MRHDGKKINVVVLWLYDPIIDKFFTGGMERWCRDVARLAQSRGYDVHIWQKSTTSFRKEIEDNITLQGIAAEMGFLGNRRLAKKLCRETRSDEPFLFVSQEISAFSNFSRFVTVNHGIWWDGDFPWWKKALNKRLQQIMISRAQATICVDTNYINWCHAELSGRAQWESRLFYVPNYADRDLFECCGNSRTVDAKKPTILFPRRVSGHDLFRHGRGAGLFIRAVELLEAQGIRPRLIFAGRGNLQSEITGWAENRGMGARVEVKEVPLDEMPEIYAQADVVVVPSLEHEGTSLSAVEGLVSGKPVVVSHIGGLCNIVIDRLNGYVCNLTPESLASSIREALMYPPLASFPGLLENCRIALGKERWEKQIWSILQSRLGL